MDSEKLSSDIFPFNDLREHRVEAALAEYVEALGQDLVAIGKRLRRAPFADVESNLISIDWQITEAKCVGLLINTGEIGAAERLIVKLAQERIPVSMV